MKRTVRNLVLAAILAASLASTGCANMTPQERANAAAAFGAVVGGAAAAAGAYADARYNRPVYVVPVRTRVCNRFGCWYE